MQKTLYSILIVFIFSNCTHHIARNGYETKKSEYKNCSVVFKKYAQLNDTLFTRIGEIKLGDPLLSTTCNEGQALHILKNEGCAINADLINIVEELKPDVMSPCYRCKAVFYKYANSNTKLRSDKNFTSSYIQDSIANERKRKPGYTIGAIVAGFVFGLLIF